jgi:hypothetical protein
VSRFCTTSLNVVETRRWTFDSRIAWKQESCSSHWGSLLYCQRHKFLSCVLHRLKHSGRLVTTRTRSPAAQSSRWSTVDSSNAVKQPRPASARRAARWRKVAFVPDRLRPATPVRSAESSVNFSQAVLFGKRITCCTTDVDQLWLKTVRVENCGETGQKSSCRSSGHSTSGTVVTRNHTRAAFGQLDALCAHS